MVRWPLILAPGHCLTVYAARRAIWALIRSYPGDGITTHMAVVLPKSVRRPSAFPRREGMEEAMTATATRTLEDTLLREAIELLDNPIQVETNEFRDGLDVFLLAAFTGRYQVWENDKADGPMAHEWCERLDETVMTAAMDAFRASLPGVARAVSMFLASDPPPAYVIAHPDAADLRADLELLEFRAMSVVGAGA